MAQNKFDEAIAACDCAIELMKGSSYDYVKMGKAMARKAACYVSKGELDTGIEIYRSALLESNDYAIKDALKKAEQKKKSADALAYINPAKAEEHKAAGIELFKKGSFVDALKEFDEGIRRDSKNIALYSNRSATYLKLMDPVRALADAELTIKMDPTFVKGYARKGTSHQMQKEYHKAMEAFEKGLKIDPNSKECTEGMQKTMQLINSTSHSSSGNDEERMRHAMADPEIQMIMRDPIIQQVLRDMQENPRAGQEALKDVHVMAKIQKLIAAGILKTA